MKRLKANGASLLSDFHRTSPNMALLRLCRIENKSTETENCYKSLNRELRWLRNSVYVANTNALISFAVTAKLICVFVLAYAKCWFSHEAALNSNKVLGV